MNIVLDTNVLVSAFRSQTGASYIIVEMIFSSNLFTVNLSVPLLTEYEAKLLGRTRTNAEVIDRFLNALVRTGKSHIIYFLYRGFLTDANDDMLLELAIKSRSSYIVTHNVKDFRGIDSFGIAVITPKDFLQIFKA